MAKDCVATVDAGEAWRWSLVQRSTDPAATVWLTDRRGHKLQSVLTGEAAFHVYPGFVMAVGSDSLDATWLDATLVALDELLGEAAVSAPPPVDPSAPEAPDPWHERTQLDWIGADFCRPESIAASPDGAKLVMTSRPNRLTAVQRLGIATFGLSILVPAIAKDGANGFSATFTFVALLFAVAGVRAAMRGVRVAEFDLKERSFWVGYQKKGRRAEPSRGSSSTSRTWWRFRSSPA